MTRRLLLTSLILLGGCGYFNSLYNANRSFATAERANRTGDHTTAAREYRSAIERAAVSYRRYPDGRWADDALLLLGRARFALGEHDAAAAAMERLLAQSQDAGIRAVAHAYLGASLVTLEALPDAVLHLDSAAAVLSGHTDDAAFTRLWRARAAFDQGRPEAGWGDLHAALGNRRVAHAAALEGVRRGFERRDSARTFEFMQQLANTPHEASTREQVDSLLTRIGRDWSPSHAFNSSAPLAEANWPADVRDAVALTRARLAASAGDADAALDIATRIAGSVSLGIGSVARRLAAEIRLARAEAPEELEEVRALLLPAYDDRAALQLMRRVRAAQILLQDGEDDGRSISLFAAAELLRDELGAPRLARRAFLSFAARQQETAWAGKAALAAHQIGATAETAAALEEQAGNPYVRAARGVSHDPAEISRAEERLAFGINGLRAEALADAIRRDVAVGRAISALDSTRTAARNDSVRIGCGMLIDTLGIGGIRADSTRTACLRGDTARVRFVLQSDTVLLRDSAAVSERPAVPGRAAPDTVIGRDTMMLRDLVQR